MCRFIVFTLALISLGIQAIDFSKAPSKRSTTVKMKETESVLSLPIQIPLTAIKTKAEKLLPDTLHTIDERRTGPCVNLLVTKKCAEVDLKGWVKRNGPLVLTGSGSTLNFKVPLKTQITAKGIGSVYKHIDQTGQGAITVDIKASIGINSKWQTRVSITTGYQWDVPFYVDVAGIKISLQKQADVAIKEELAKVEVRLKKQISEQVNLHKIANTAWALLQKPVMIEPKSNLWLDMKPQTAFINYVGVKDKVFTVDAGVLTKSQARIDTMVVKPEPTPIPDIAPPSKLKGLNMRVPLVLSFDQMVSRLAVKLGTFEGLKVINMAIYPHRNSLVLALGVEVNNSEGTVYLSSKPQLDTRNRVISLSGLEYTKPVEHDFWDDKNKAARKQLLERVKQIARYDYSADLQKVQTLATQKLGTNWADGVSVAAVIDSITLYKLITAEQGIVLDAGIGGSITANLVLDK